MSSYFASLADLAFPRRCVGCGSAGSLLCAACAPADGLHRVGAATVADWPAGGEVYAAGHYAGGLRDAVLAYKERDRRDL
ncbi:MAG TPA: hypothetical protein VK816_04440, partial [Jatrophihabitantaceae bacterium]|nr:hypothetical protein [Jatrophihabitantaceae bacterium]